MNTETRPTPPAPAIRASKRIFLDFGDIAPGCSWVAPAGTSQRVQRNDFEGVDTLLEKLRIERARDASGIWKMSVVFEALNGVFSGIETREDLAQARARIDAVGKAHPRSTNVALMHVIALERYAFAQDQDTKEGAAEYTLAMLEARSVLDAAKAVAAANPHWYAERIALASYTQEDPAVGDRLLTESIAREPLFYQSWFSNLFLRVRGQGGSLDRAAALVNQSLQHATREEGISMYARLLWFAEQFGSSDLLTHPAISWDTAQKSMADVLKAYPDQRNVQQFFWFACQKGDMEVARRFVKDFQDPPSGMFGRTGRTVAKCKDVALGIDKDGFWLSGGKPGDEVWIGDRAK